MKTAALIVAAGKGTRAAGSLPKQYALLGGVPVLARTLKTFLDHAGVDLVQVVVAAGDGPLYASATRALTSAKLLEPVTGGATRQISVLHGLAGLASRSPDRVLIHDAARPFVTADVIDRVLAGLLHSPGAIAAIPLDDTLKRSGPDSRIAGTLDRSGLWRAQTPQGFRFADILAAHQRAQAAARDDLTDDAGVAEWVGLPVSVVPGSITNTKLTSAEDIAMAQRAFAPPDVRSGQGFDVHRLVGGDHVWLAGIRIPHTHALEGHSDADVALHALTDALLGAIGEGDIGQHFPDTDPRWKGAASEIFVREAVRLVRERGAAVGNVDLTLLCESPRIAPHREAMRRTVAGLVGIDEGRVNIKATTTERLGFLGRREGIAALATATVVFT